RPARIARAAPWPAPRTPAGRVAARPRRCRTGRPPARSSRAAPAARRRALPRRGRPCSARKAAADQLAQVVEADLRNPVAALMLEHALGQQVLFHALRGVADLDPLLGQEPVGLAGGKAVVAAAL